MKETRKEQAGRKAGSDTAAKTGTADRQTDEGAVDAEHGRIDGDETKDSRARS